jgi:hypothetical protein
MSVSKDLGSPFFAGRMRLLVFKMALISGTSFCNAKTSPGQHRYFSKSQLGWLQDRAGRS